MYKKNCLALPGIGWLWLIGWHWLALASIVLKGNQLTTKEYKTKGRFLWYINDFHCVFNKQDKVRSVVIDKKYSPWTEGTHQNAHVGHECMQTNTTWPIDMNSLDGHHP